MMQGTVMGEVCRLVAVVSLFGLLSAARAAEPPPATPTVLFTGRELPAPPQAGTEWQPPVSQLPEVWGSAVKVLLRYGFGDPRSCEYREVEIACGNAWSNRGFLVKTHAWVIPLRPGDAANAPRFAVTWSGLVYPAATVGEPADLKADVEQQLPAPPSRSWLPEAALVDHKLSHPLRGCLLFVLGEAALAERAWKQAGPQLTNPRTKKPWTDNGDPYLGLVREWAWVHFDRAVCAHLRGDDVVALASAEMLVRLRAEVEQEAPRHGFQPPQDSDHRPQSLLEFLDAIEVLAEDQARRVKADPVTRVLAKDAAPIADAKERIAALIRDLEIVDETQHSQPGGVSVDASPVVKALVKEGPPAVEPLLVCLETDRRLTRSVSFHRDFFPTRQWIGVDQAAFAALQGILKTRSFGPQTEYGYRSAGTVSDDKRRLVAQEVREFWNRMKTYSDAERWYRVLADATATDKQWLEAAENITRRVPRPAPPPGQKVKIPPIAAELNDDRPLQGAELRSRTQPSVSELLAERSDRITTLETNSTRRVFLLAEACKMTLYLARWEPSAALPALRRRIEQCRELQRDKFYGPYAKLLNGSISPLVMAGADAGAAEFTAEYVEWLKELRPEQVEPPAVLQVFRPLGRYPDNPELSRLATKLFSAGSLWLPLSERLGHNWYQLVNSPLVSVPAFRELLKAQLRNQESMGTLTIEGTTWKLTTPSSMMSQRIARPLATDDVDPANPPAMRYGDFIAWKLSTLEGAPEFEPYWSTSRKDAAVARLTAFLDRWGHAFRDRSRDLTRPVSPFDTARFRLDKLSQPATPDDATAGRAIFSLAATGAQVRIVALPILPQMARWKTLTEFPVNTTGPSDTRPGQPTTAYDCAGYIWQAEEVRVDGGWQRFYGFVGNHVVAKVPANEVEFLEEFGQEPLLRW